MGDVDPPRGEGLPRIAAVEPCVESAGLEAGRIQRAASGKTASIAAQRELAADEPERAGEMPGAQVEILDHGLTLPVPAVCQIQHVAADVAVKGSGNPSCDGQLVEIPGGIGGELPLRLISRLP